MENKKTIITIAVILAVLILSVVVMGIISNKKEYKYNFVYHDEFIPGSTYYIYVYNDRIEVTEEMGCSAVDCDNTTEKTTLNYSKENIEKLGKFLDSISYTDGMELYRDTLDERTKEIITCLLLDEKLYELAIEEYNYKYELYHSDKESYALYVKDDNSVLVKKITNTGDDNESKYSIDTYKINFSDEHMEIIRDFIKNSGTTKYNNESYKNIIKSIIENNEDYLKDIDTSVTLIYIISYDGLNCLTPSLYFYSDNTYEYYYTFSTNGETIVPKKGTYNYDLDKLYERASSYEESPTGPYYITNKDDSSVTTYDTNTELKELLSSINISLEQCLVNQE